MSYVRTAGVVLRGRVTAGAVRAFAVALLTAVLTAVLPALGGSAVAAPVPATDEPPRQGGATATLEGLTTYGQAVVREDGEELQTGAGLFEMAVDGGGTLQTYGLDVDNPTQQHARYGETDWDQTSLHANANAGKILWILRHSYPQVNDLQALAKSSGAGKLTPKTAAAGTQVAIWRYTDGPGTPGDADVRALDPGAEKLADHLQRKARTMAEPKASLSLGRVEVSGRPGGRLGPVTVRTDAPGVGITTPPGAAARGIRVVEGDGKPVTKARDGGRLYFEVPEEGRATGASSLTVQAATKVPVGRAFTGVGGHGMSQAQILAGSSQSTVSATATVNWSQSGVVPAVTAEKNCAKGGVDVTVASADDPSHHFELAGKEYELPVHGSRTITVPVEEDQSYRIPVTASAGPEKTVTGVLDCATKSAYSVSETEGLKPQAQTATVGGAGADEDAADGSGDLAETGASNTSLIAGLAVGLVFLGMVALLIVRRHKAGGGEQP